MCVLVACLLGAVSTLSLTTAADSAKQPVAAATKKGSPSNQSQLEQKLQQTLSSCVFDGRWSPLEKGKLGPEYNDRYSIQGISKSGKGVWLVYATIEYAGKDITVPVPVKVKWAGDTPVITLDKVSIPGMGTYSARVLIYEGTYAGTWSAGDHGGMLHGVIEKQGKTTK